MYRLDQFRTLEDETVLLIVLNPESVCDCTPDQIPSDTVTLWASTKDVAVAMCDIIELTLIFRFIVLFVD